MNTAAAYAMDIRAVHRPQKFAPLPEDFPFTLETARQVRAFHRTIPGYVPTPLVSLERLSKLLGVAGLYVKDESARFDLNAFKVLGGSWAAARYLGQRLGLGEGELTFSRLAREDWTGLTLVTATDGNHGRGLAWTAQKLGIGCVVFMPAGSARERLEHIRALGARAEITDRNYDDTVRLAAQYAREHGGVLMQDTTVSGGPGYEEIPTHIMQGYMTMADEAAEQLPQPPTHVFLQAGVGAMAGAVTGYLAARYGEKRPKVIVVEPDRADCVFRTALADDGQLHAATGSLSTMMAGLACGEPCTVGWRVLSRWADHFVSMPDHVAAAGMRVLGAPVLGDGRIVSGESGAAGFGLALLALSRPELAPLRERLGLDQNSRVLCLSTEGATDQANYRRVVWGLDVDDLI